MGLRLKRGEELRAEDGEESSETETKGGSFLTQELLEDERGRERRGKRDITESELRGGMVGMVRLSNTRSCSRRRRGGGVRPAVECRNLHRTTTRP